MKMKAPPTRTSAMAVLKGKFTDLSALIKRTEISQINE
jgi:hypothetical protein